MVADDPFWRLFRRHRRGISLFEFGIALEAKGITLDSRCCRPLLCGGLIKANEGIAGGHTIDV
jgi:hypothetical protein